MSEVIDETKPVAQITSSEQGELRNRRNDSVYVAANRRPSVDSVPEREQAPPVRADRNLNSVDVACLIINKMIGTGIFTAPVSTLLATNSKGLVLLFWILGFIYTLISMCLYLELARELPMSGGELVYLDRLFRAPRLLAYTMYTIYFITLYTSTSNSIQTGYYVLLASNVKRENMSIDLICFIGVVMTTAICLLMYFSSVKSRWFNTFTAVTKVVLMVVVFCAGCYYVARHPTNASTGWQITSSEPGWTSGIFLVFFSYHGWENATYVAGEIPRYEVLRKGFIAAVLIVGTLYVMVVAIVCAAWNPAGAIDPVIAAQYMPYMARFFSGSEDVTVAARQAAAILIILSAIGSMVSVAYTAVRVKQAIGWANILPLSSLWRRTSLSTVLRRFLRKPGANDWREAVAQAVAIRPGTPEGGIILHWIFSVIFAGVVRGFYNPATPTTQSNSLSLAGSLLIFGHFVFEVLVGIGYALNYTPKPARLREIPLTEWNAPEAYEWYTKGRRGIVALGCTTAGVALFILGVTVVSEQGRVYLYVNLGIILFAVIFWATFSWRPSRQNLTFLGITITRTTHGQGDAFNPWRQCSMCASHPKGQAHRHREDGYLEYNIVKMPDTRLGRFLGFEWLIGDVEDVGKDQGEAEAYANEMDMRILAQRDDVRAAERGESSSTLESHARR